MSPYLIHAALLFQFAFQPAADPSYLSIQKKFDDIEQERARRGSRIFLSLKELNAYAREQAFEIAPKGLREIRVVLQNDAASATGKIDFVELNKSRTGQTNWLMERFFQGERDVRVNVRVQTRNGEARVDVDRVEVGGAVVEGAALQFLIEHYVIPEFPDAKVAQWFKMPHHMDHLEIRPTGVTVAISR